MTTPRPDPVPGAGGGSLTDVCIRHPVLAWVIMLVVLLFGAVAFSKIPVSQFPDVDEPTVDVRLNWEGASPEALEREVVETIEEALIQVEGVTEIRSTSRQGSASVTVTLEVGRNVDAAVQDVQSRIAQVQRRLPADLDPPSVQKSNPDDNPIMWISLSGPFPPRVLADYTRYKVRERLQLVPGVGELIIGGNIDRNIRIWLRPEALVARSLTAAEVLTAVRRNHVELPAGEIEGGGRTTLVRVLGEAASLEEMRALRVGGTALNPVRLEDVALIEDGFADITRINRINGEAGQGLGVRKQRGANALAVGAGVRAELDLLRKELPEGMELGVNYDATPFIQQSIDALIHEIGLAILLTAAVCWLFLRSWTSTLNVILAIPMSLLGTVAVSWFLGWSLNTFTLLGLGLAVGIVVDDAILVMENIIRRREAGEGAATAASRGTREIAFSALVATIAIIAIIMPVVFMRGMIGRFFLQFGVALSIAVMLSYLEAVTLAPSRCARLLRAHRKTHADAPGWFTRTYARVVNLAVTWPKTIILAGFVLVGVGLFALKALPQEFIPAQDQGTLRLRFVGETGASLADTDTRMLQAQAILLAHPAVARAYLVTGGGGGGVNGGFGFLTLVPQGQRPPQAAVMADLRRSLGGIPGLRVVVQDLSQSAVTGSRGFPIDIALTGSDFIALGHEADRLGDVLTSEGLAVDVDVDFTQGLPEIRLTPDRARCVDLNVDIEDVADTLAIGVAGTLAGKYSVDGRRIDIRARVIAAARQSPEDILALYVRNRQGTLIPLSDLVHVEERATLQAITRRDRERSVGLTANVAPGASQGAVLERIRALAATLPDGVHVRFLGGSAGFQDGVTDLLFAGAIGLILAYLVLAAQFDSWIHPLTVLTVIPIAIAGGLVALLVSGQAISLFSMIGFILLMGLAKKNSIVLVDFASRAQKECGDPREAMRRAAPMRFRPIVMTAIATIAGAMPIALGVGAGSEVRRPMALAIVGGMIVATVLSLIVVPAVYVVMDRFRRREENISDDEGAESA